MRFSIFAFLKRMIKSYFNKGESLIDYILKKTLKRNAQYSSEFKQIELKKIKLQKEVYQNDQLTKLVCRVVCDQSYSKEFRFILLKNLILPKEVFLYKKFTMLVCKVVVTPMSRSFIKMMCKETVPKKVSSKTRRLEKVVVPRKRRGRPVGRPTKLRVLSSSEINESYLNKEFVDSFFKCRVLLTKSSKVDLDRAKKEFFTCEINKIELQPIDGRGSSDY